MGCPTTYNGYNTAWTRGKLSALSNGSALLGHNFYNYSYNAYGQRVGVRYTFSAGTSSSAVAMGTLTGYNKLFSYDQSGRLICESKTSAYYGEGNANEKTVFLYDESGIVGMQHTGSSAAGIYYFHRNLLGDVVGIYNSTGNNTYAQYNPFRYRGYYYDTDTQFYYLQSRYYDPVTGRFLNADGYINANGDLIGFNMYAYCSNNPIKYVDYSGEDAIYFWVSTLPIVGHAAVFIETTEGWYLIQFAPESKDGWKKSKAKVLVEYIGDYEQVLSHINRREDSKYIYIHGDFAQSINTANNYVAHRENNGYDGEYKLIRNNCLHLVLDILSEGTFTDNNVKDFINGYTGFIPIDFYNQLSKVATKKRYSGRTSTIINKSVVCCCLKE